MTRTIRTTRRGATLAVLTTAALLLGATAAVADNVQNDVTAGGNDTITAGGSTTVSYRITANNGDGETGCNATAASPAVVSVVAPAGVTANPSSLTFTSCGTSQPVAFTSATPGSYAITVSVSDSGPGSYNANPASFTLKVNPAAPTNTAPAVSVTGVTDGASYEIGHVPAAGCEVVDEDEGASAAPQTSGTLTHGLGQQTVTCSYTDSGGLTGSASATYAVVDTGDPTITYALTDGAGTVVTPNAAGWFDQDVTVAFDCADPGLFGGLGSGIASCGPDATLGEGADQSVTGTAVDHAGNSSQATASGIDIDTTAPAVGFAGGPADGSSHHFGSVPAAPTCDGSDALSGLADCQVSGHSTAVGTHTLVATATDVAGNTATATRSYTVQAWTFGGFYRPVDMGGVLNTVKGGSTVPLKFELFAGSELTDPSLVSLAVTKVACETREGADAIEVLSAGSTSLRYDSAEGQFVQNWKTPNTPGQCYRATMTALDGSRISALFKTK